MGELRTNEQHKRLFGLLAKLNWMEYRYDLASSFSNQRTDSTSKLSIEECDAMITMLQNEVKKYEVPQEPTKLNKMRGKFFHYCHELNWKKNGKLDDERITNWLLKYGYMKKPLNDYTEKQMYRLLQQIEKVLEKQTKPKL
jgi:hypothetical protein